MRIDHFLVLGAGASFGARPRHTTRPPLGADLAEYLQQWLRENEEARNWILESNPRDTTQPPARFWREVDETPLKDLVDQATEKNAEEGAGFERVLGELVEKIVSGEAELEQHQLPRVLHSAMGWSMLTGVGCAFGEGEDLFDEVLFRGLPSDRTAIISLNYDTLFEEAAVRASGVEGYLQTVHYPGFECHTSPKGWPMYKLHGSINWLQNIGHAVGRSADLEVAQRQVTEPLRVSGQLSGTETGRTYVPPAGRTNLILQLKQSVIAHHQTMALYAADKPSPVNSETIESVRDACVRAIRANPSASATAIGIHIPKDTREDPALSRVLEELQQCTGSRLYVSPSESDCATAERYGFVACKATLEDWLSGA